MQDKPTNDPNLDDDLDDMMLEDDFNDEFSEDYDPDADVAGGDETVSYADTGSYNEDDYLDDDDWEDEEEFETPSQDAGAQRPKLKGLNISFNTAVIIGAVIVGLGVLVWQVVSKKPQMMETVTTALQMGGVETSVFSDSTPSAPENQNTTPDVAADTPPMPAPVSPAEEASPEEQAGLPEPQESPLTPMPEAPAAPTVETADGQVPRSPDQSPPPPSYPIDATEMDHTAPNKAEDMLKTAMAAREQTSADAFGEDDVPAADAPVAPETAAPAPTAEEPVPPLSENVNTVIVPVPPENIPPVSEAATAELNQKMDSIIAGFSQIGARIDDINNNSNNQINALRDELKNEIAAVREEVKNAPAPAASGNNNGSNEQTAKEIAAVREEMQTALAQIKEEIKNAPASAAAPTASASGANEEQLAAMRESFDKEMAQMREEVKKATAAASAAQAKREESAPVRAPQSPAPAAVAPAVPKTAAAPQQAAPKKSSGGAWQLKAAKPGKAWVSRAGDSNIRGVGVGDTLDGVGRITAITFMNGRWLVKGTAGQIVQ